MDFRQKNTRAVQKGSWVKKVAEKQTVKMEFIDYDSCSDSYDTTEIIDLSNHDLGCPMPPEGTDLSCQNLSLEQRMWLAKVVISGQFKIAELAKKWNMKYKQVQKYSYRMKRGRIPQERIGRPRILDDVGMRDVKWSMQTCNSSDRRLIRPIIEEVYEDSYKRKRLPLEIIENVPLPMPKRSRNRYIAHFLGDCALSSNADISLHV